MGGFLEEVGPADGVRAAADPDTEGTADRGDTAPVNWRNATSFLRFTHNQSQKLHTPIVRTHTINKKKISVHHTPH